MSYPHIIGCGEPQRENGRWGGRPRPQLDPLVRLTIPNPRTFPWKVPDIVELEALSRRSSCAATTAL